MSKKRLIGVVTVKDHIAVQSFGYKRYYPLGKPEILIKNLDAWGADEILVNLIDRSTTNKGPDFNLIKKIASLKITTPIIYGGGISSIKEAVEVIKLGADRILIESILNKDIEKLIEISNKLGSQAIILSLPVNIKQGKINQFNYLNNKSTNISYKIVNLFNKKLISEILLSDVVNEGQKNSFNLKILKHFKKFNIPSIVFGGIGSKELIKEGLKYSFISAIAVGNSLNYQEDTIFKLKNSLTRKYFRH